MYKKILLATDLLESSQELVAKAVALSKTYQASLDVIHVVEPPMTAEYAAALGFATFPEASTREAELVMQAFGDAHGIAAEHQHVSVGKVSTQIIELAKQLKSDLILIGSHGSSGLGQLLGSTAHSVVHQAPSDVLLIRIRN